MNREAILEAMAAHGLGHLRDALAGVMKPSIRVTAETREGRPELGRSRFGGQPDLAAGSAWPTVDGIPLGFVGQVDLKELTSFEAAAALPGDGLLSFFFDRMLTGYERGQKPDRCRVIHTPAPVALRRLDPPAGAPELDPSVMARFEEEWTLPELEEIDGADGTTFPAFAPILRTPGERTSYRKLRRAIRGRFIGSRLLGHADAVQGGEVRFNAVRSQDHEQRFRYEDYEWTNLDRLVAEMRDLELLLQVASGPGEPWPGPGVLDFWIRGSEREQARFDGCFAQLLST